VTEEDAVTSNGAPAGSAEPAEIDTSRAHAARVYDYLLGGRANFKVDREVAAITYAAWPGGIEAVRADVREHRAALGRVVRYFVRDAGITQFLDIGTGIPKQNNVHEVAQAEATGARIVYVDWDPIVLAHAHQLLRGTREGTTSYIYGDLHDPQPIMREAAKTLDFSRPVAVMLFGILHFFSDADDPRGVIGQRPALGGDVRDVQPAQLAHGRDGHPAQPRRGGRAAVRAGTSGAGRGAGQPVAARSGYDPGPVPGVARRRAQDRLSPGPIARIPGGRVGKAPRRMPPKAPRRMPQKPLRGRCY
jgi:hypothetical protein